MSIKGLCVFSPEKGSFTYFYFLKAIRTHPKKLNFVCFVFGPENSSIIYTFLL